MESEHVRMERYTNIDCRMTTTQQSRNKNPEIIQDLRIISSHTKNANVKPNEHILLQIVIFKKNQRAKTAI